MHNSLSCNNDLGVKSADALCSLLIKLPKLKNLMWWGNTISVWLQCVNCFHYNNYYAGLMVYLRHLYLKSWLEMILDLICKYYVNVLLYSIIFIIIMYIACFLLIEWLAKAPRAPSKSYLGIIIESEHTGIILQLWCSLLCNCFSRFGDDYRDINFDSSYFQAHLCSAVFIQALK